MIKTIQDLNKRFIKIRETNPSLGDFIVLCEAVKNQIYTNSLIKKGYKVWVKDCPEYGKKEKDEYLNYLFLKTIPSI